jgi:predicted AlkP superfamily phosphohydrolase/phosphomutase
MRSLLLLFAFHFSLLTFAQTHVVVLGFDGMSGAGVQQTATPHFDEIKKNGAFTYKAESVIPTVSSPNWAAMIMVSMASVFAKRANPSHSYTHSITAFGFC